MYVGAVARERPDTVAYVLAGPAGEERESVTYRQLDERSNRLANLLWDRGLRPGDVLAICMDNHPRFLEVAWAAQRSGLCYTPANWRLTPDELTYVVNDSGARAVVVSPATARLAGALLDRTPAVRTRLAVGVDVAGHERYERAVAAHPPTPLPREVEGADMLYSSGTTGRPKGVRIPLGFDPIGTPNPLVVLMRGLYGVGPDSVYLSPAPLYHAAPLRYCMTLTRVGGTAVIMERFEPAAFLALVERYRATHTQVAPTMFVRLLKMPARERLSYDTSSLRAVIHAAAPCPVEVKRRVIDWLGPIVHEYYAGTEGNGYVACTAREWLDHPGTVGRALLGVVHVTDELGREFLPGETGVVWFSDGPDFSYHGDPARTAEAHDARGWSTLGDIGHLDGDGYLYLTDRQAYMIITGGVNVYPQEVEDLLVTHPAVLDAAVFGMPDEDLGEKVQAVVQPLDPAADPAALAAELMAYCREHLTHVRCPKAVDVVDELPRHPTGKLYKRLLVERYHAAAAG